VGTTLPVAQRNITEVGFQITSRKFLEISQKFNLKTIYKLFADQKCLTFMETGHSETFEQFEIKTNNIAANLLANGAKPGDRLGQFP